MGSKGGGTTSSTTSTTNTYDPEASRRLAAVSERQQAMAEEQWRMYKAYFQQYEIDAAKLNSELLPYISDAAKATLVEEERDVAQNQPIKDAMRSNQLKELGYGAKVTDKFYKEAVEGVDKESWQREAQADAIQGADQASETTRREAARMGINVSDPAMAERLRANSMDRAKMVASARFGAGKAAEGEGWNRIGVAMNAQRSNAGLPGIQSTQGNNTQQIVAGDPAGQAGAFMQGASQGYGTLASRVLSSTGQTTQTTPQSSGFGQVLGTAAGVGMNYALGKWFP